MAAAGGFDAATLTRMLDYLASQEVLLRDHDGRYAHTPFSRMLRSDHASNLQAFLHTTSTSLETGAVMHEALRTGMLAQQVRHGMGYFEYLEANTAHGEAFARFMTATTTDSEQFILARHDFRPFDLAIDVGGNHGSLLLRLLADHRDAHGIVFDLPEVIERAESHLANHPLRGRIDLIGGSFFDAVPSGGDLYLLKQILHDWEDEECVAILRAVRAAIAPHGRLAVVDRLMPEAPTPHPAYYMDVFMLMLLGGKERTRSEFEALFEQSGFRLDRVTEDPNFPCVIEAVPV
jgi:hypothetical protein